MQVSILTDPIPTGHHLLSEGVRRLKRRFRNNKSAQYRGHPGVTRSLVEGLMKIKANFNYNPVNLSQLAENVIILSNVKTLHQAISLKQKGIIKKLYAGPNIVIYSSDCDSILSSTEINYIITPSKWVTDLYIKDNLSLKDRCITWPAGVNMDYWKYNGITLRDKILIFDKQHIFDDPEIKSVIPVKLYVDYLTDMGWDVDILRYGFFTHEEYLNKLQSACLMIGFSLSESQGLAWAEAWSTDVPVMVLKNRINTYRKKRYSCSSAPYLSPHNGLFFDDITDFKTKLYEWKENRNQFTPRDWVSKNMSDEICAMNLYNHTINH